jgi:hypothetical protein
MAVLAIWAVHNVRGKNGTFQTSIVESIVTNRGARFTSKYIFSDNTNFDELQNFSTVRLPYTLHKRISKNK